MDEGLETTVLECEAVLEDAEASGAGDSREMNRAGVGGRLLAAVEVDDGSKLALLLVLARRAALGEGS